MKKIKRLQCSASILLCLLATSLSQASHAQNSDDDIQMFIPAMIAGIEGPKVDVCFARDFIELPARARVTLVCDLDLGATSVTLPPNAQLLNPSNRRLSGRVVFRGGLIDGSILNPTLGIEGDAELVDSSFVFSPSRWGIVEGNVSKGVANRNRLRARQAMVQAIRFGADEFQIGKMDAYFFGEGFQQYLFRLPSNFHLKMASNTVLRTFVNTSSNATIEIYDVENVRVSGGQMIGARNIRGGNQNIRREHIIVSTGKNVVIERMRLSLAATDAISVRSSRLARDPDYIPSDNVIIRNNIFNANRRNNMAVVDGQNIIIEGNTFLNAGIDLANSRGIAPRWALDIEPVGHGSPNGLQRVNGVIVRNNTERGSAAGAVVAADGDDILITGNNFERGISYVAASNVTITNNTLSGIGIAAGQIGPYERSRNIGNVISGNTISNCFVGITASNRDIKIFGNTIRDCQVGVLLSSAEDSEVYENTIISRGVEGDGINAITSVENVTIRDNNIDVDDKGFFFNGVNGSTEQAGNRFLIEDNTVKNGAVNIFSFIRGLTFNRNVVTGFGTRLDGVRNTNFTNNTLNTTRFGVLEFGKSFTTDLVINNNDLNYLDLGGGEQILTAIASNPQASNNILISNNRMTSRPGITAMRIEGFNGITVRNNVTDSFGLAKLIKYRGNNSLFENNVSTAGPTNNDIQGTNNTVR